MDKHTDADQIVGQHVLLDLHGCDVAVLGDVAQLQSLLLQAAEAVQATVLFYHFHHFGGDSGVTGVLLLAESHITIHTWTERAFAAADIFICGKHADFQAACHILRTGLRAQSEHLSVKPRGMQTADYSK